LKKFIKNSYWLIIISIVIVALDQYTKWLVRSNLAMGETWSPWEWLAPYARIVYWKNTGVAFGLLQGMNPVFIVLAIIVSIGILYFFQSIPKKEWLIRLALILELGGALGNLIDRITVGHVIDFISVGNFPVFNVADSCITVGVFVLLLGVWLQDRREKKEAKSKSDEGSSVNETLP
jgi:signal peptidase II